MSDVGIQVGDVPGGPPINLPAAPGTPRPRIAIIPDPSRVVPFNPNSPPLQPRQGDFFASEPDWKPPASGGGNQPGQRGDFFAAEPDWKPQEQKPAPEVSG